MNLFLSGFAGLKPFNPQASAHSGWGSYLDVKGWSSNPIAIAVATTYLGLP
jgi:hypothetical protein